MQLEECIAVLRAGFAAPCTTIQAAEALLDCTGVFELAVDDSILHGLPRGRGSKKLRG